jgi:hypothetical protein
MAARWMQAKAERAKIYKRKAQGRHGTWHGWTFEEKEEKVEMTGRVCALPTSLAVKQAEREAIAASTVNVKRCATLDHKLKDTRPISDEMVRGRLMRKARHGSVKLWSGTDGAPCTPAQQRENRKHGTATLRWAPVDRPWEIVKKA